MNFPWLSQQFLCSRHTAELSPQMHFLKYDEAERVSCSCPIKAIHSDFYAFVYLVLQWSVFLPQHIPTMTVLEEIGISHLYEDSSQPIQKAFQCPALCSTELQTNSKVTALEEDILDAQFLKRVCQGISLVIHTASVIDILGTIPRQTIMDVNLKGTITGEDGSR